MALETPAPVLFRRIAEDGDVIHLSVAFRRLILELPEDLLEAHDLEGGGVAAVAQARAKKRVGEVSLIGAHVFDSEPAAHAFAFEGFGDEDPVLALRVSEGVDRLRLLSVVEIGDEGFCHRGHLIGRLVGAERGQGEGAQTGHQRKEGENSLHKPVVRQGNGKRARAHSARSFPRSLTIRCNRPRVETVFQGSEQLAGHVLFRYNPDDTKGGDRDTRNRMGRPRTTGR